MPGNARKSWEEAKSCYAAGALSSACMKTRLCTFFSKGGCPRDRFCKFAHGEEELQSAPDFTCTKMCPALMRSGFCRRGASCKFAHNEDELRPIAEVLPEPTVAAALVAAWQRKSERCSDVSTNASDGAESEASSSGSFGRESHSMRCELDEFVALQRAISMTSRASQVLVVDGSFLDTITHIKEGSRLLHAPTGMTLAIRNGFFDVDERPALPAAARRCSSADARLGAPQRFA